MSKTIRLNLEKVEDSLNKVEKKWKEIDDELDQKRIGRKDTPFDTKIKHNMLSAYEFMDSLLKKGVEPFTKESLEAMLEINYKVHCNNNARQRMEYQSFMNETRKKFYTQVQPIKKWYEKHTKRNDHPLKISSEIYVGILGRPQLFIEGNHRSGAIISSWIDMHYGYPPFVLSPDNAIAYFAPSREIKAFADKTTWRGRWKLPKYQKEFRKFWEANIDKKYVR